MLIGLDPGHGGKDFGASSGLITEANYVWEFCNRLETMFSLAGHKIVKSRPKIEDPIFKQRAVALEKADVVFSIHVNAAQPQASGGIFFWNGDSVSKDKNLALAQLLYKYWPPALRRLKESTSIWRVGAQEIAKQAWLSRAHNVIKRHNQPTILAELFFLTSSYDVKVAAHPFTEEAMRWAFMRAIDAFSN